MSQYDKRGKKKRIGAKAKWREYERRKRGLASAGLSPKEYERVIKAIAEELGL